MLVAAALAVGACCVIARSVEDPDRASELVNNLRRTLLEDNLDYYAEHNNKSETDDDEMTKSSEGQSELNNFYIPGLTQKISNRSRNKPEPEKLEHKVSNTDWFYYAADQDLVDKSNRKHETGNDKMATKTYKVLKLKHNYRRAGQARLVQEESKERVVIVNMNKGPIPEIRLPKSRRQYMHAHGEVVLDDEELPPPLVNTSDPEAAPGEDTVTEPAATEAVKQ